jgi:SAM-dependent methyltransferase
LSFQDHFSGHAGDYAQFRPVYPDLLFQRIASLCETRDLVWDVGCGNGQASLGLAKQFGQVHATDASAQQIAQAPATPNIMFKAEPAEACSLPSHSADAVVIAQALHWFDHDRFYQEVRRVAKPGGLVVAVTYVWAKITPQIDDAMWRFVKGDTFDYWPPDRAFVDQEYRTLPFPFPRLEFPPTDLTMKWPLEGLLAYVSTWSAVRRYIAATGRDPVPDARALLAPLWGAPDTVRDVTWRLVVLAGRV